MRQIDRDCKKIQFNHFWVYQYTHTVKIVFSIGDALGLIAKSTINVTDVGKTKREFKDNFAEHRDYVKLENVSQAAGEHFNFSGYSVADFKGKNHT